MRLGGLLSRLRREASSDGQATVPRRAQRQAAPAAPPSAVAQYAPSHNVPGANGAVAPQPLTDQIDMPAELKPPPPKRPKRDAVNSSSTVEDDAAAIAERKLRLMAQLQESHDTTAPPVAPEPAREPVPLSETGQNLYLQMLNHFKEHPEELQEFASKIILDSLHHMSSKFGSPTQQQLKQRVTPSPALSPSLLPSQNVRRIPIPEQRPMEAGREDIDAMNVDAEPAPALQPLIPHENVALVDADAEPPAVQMPEQQEEPSSLSTAPDWIPSPSLIREASNEYNTNSSFLKGVKWSPDGTKLLSCCEDNILRIYDTSNVTAAVNESADGSGSEMAPCVTVSEAETIYDFCWYPYSYSSVPGSSVFLSSTRDHPIHLWDAESGSIRATYRAYDHNDEISSAFGLCFTPDGSKIIAGYNNQFRVFDLSRPGRDCESYLTVTQRGHHRFVPRNMQLKGIISTFSFPAAMTENSFFAAGSYSGNVGLYSSNDYEPIGMLYNAAPNGVSQVLVSSDGNHLFTGGRKDDSIHCWDIRNTMQIVFSMPRPVTNNQRLSFSLDPSGRYLTSGLQDGSVVIYDVMNNGSLVGKWSSHNDVVNAAAFHPYLPLIATSSGQRRFELDISDDDSEDSESDKTSPQITTDNSVKIWKL